MHFRCSECSRFVGRLPDAPIITRCPTTGRVAHLLEVVGAPRVKFKVRREELLARRDRGAIARKRVRKSKARPIAFADDDNG